MALRARVAAFSALIPSSGATPEWAAFPINVMLFAKNPLVEAETPTLPAADSALLE